MPHPHIVEGDGVIPAFQVEFLAGVVGQIGVSLGEMSEYCELCLHPLSHLQGLGERTETQTDWLVPTDLVSVRKEHFKWVCIL